MAVEFKLGRCMGQGSCGTVYRGIHPTEGRLLAIKEAKRPERSHNNLRDKPQLNKARLLEKEIRILQDLKHPNIVRLVASSVSECCVTLSLEYEPGGSISSMLEEFGPFGEALCLKLTREILQGLQYLHSLNLIHGDIKGSNILLSASAEAKIADFGLSKPEDEERPLQGSHNWMAPEIVLQTSYTRKVDIWATGCVVIEMFTERYPYHGLTYMQIMQKVC